MSIRHVIKRDRIAAPSESDSEAAAHRARPSAAGRRAVTPGARLVELAPGRYAVEHTCRCGEVSLLELETDASPSHQESRS